MGSIPDGEHTCRPITTLPPSARALTLLQQAGIQSIGELVPSGHTSLMGIRGFGYASPRSVRHALSQIGLKLVGD